MRLSIICRSSNPLSNVKDISLIKKHGFINNEWLEGQGYFDVCDPSTGNEIAVVAKMGRKQAQDAVNAANTAFAKWRKTPVKERSATLMRWHALMLENADDLAKIMTAEQGKPLAEAKGEVIYAASFLEWFAEEAKRTYGETIPSNDPSKRYLVIKQPIGVCAAITPWNFPLAMITRKVSPAIAAGCSVIIKPAGQTPLSALACAELGLRAGLPPGVLNVVTGDHETSAEIGDVWCKSDVVRHLSFTGSTGVGKLLMKQCADTVKKVALELGGNAPFIVFNDADLDSAVEGAMISKFRNAGQTCVCANRMYVQDGIYDEFVKRFAAKATQIKVGNGFEEGVTQGPLIDVKAMDKAAAHIADALKKGAKIVVGGEKMNDRMFTPTVLSHVTQDMLCAREETFGPVAPIFKFHTEDEVIQYANATEFGLASYLYTRDVGRIFRVGEALEYGMVGVNTGLVSTAEAPFGGIKQSGIGREGSRHGIDEYLEMKYMCLGDIHK